MRVLIINNDLLILIIIITIMMMIIIIGALGSTPKELEANLQDLGIQKWLIPVLQKSVLLNSFIF